MKTYRKVILAFETSGGTPSVRYDLEYLSGDRATGVASRDFAMQLVGQFYPTEMSLLQQALAPVPSTDTSTGTGTTTPTTPTTTTPSTTTPSGTVTVGVTLPGVGIKVGL